jgi:hypothetical protein
MLLMLLPMLLMLLPMLLPMLLMLLLMLLVHQCKPKTCFFAPQTSLFK